jgi:hypothetical protein
VRLATPPLAVGSITAAVANASEFLVTFAPLAGDARRGGLDVTYQVSLSLTESPESVVTVVTVAPQPADATLLTARVGGTLGESYFVHVRAVNDEGAGPWSQHPQSPLLLFQPPSAPLGVDLGVKAAGGGRLALVVSMDQPLTGNGAAVTGFLVGVARAGSGQLAGNVFETSEPRLEVTRLFLQEGDSERPLLDPGAVYSVRAAARNGPDSVGPFSQPVEALLALVPSAPALLAATAVPGGASTVASMLVSFALPPDFSTGGLPLLDFAVRWKAVGSVEEGVLVVPASVAASLTGEATVLGLPVGLRVDVTVTARNAKGSSPSSRALPCSFRFVPPAPTGLRVEPLSLTSVAVSWTPPPTNGGASLLGYQLALASCPLCQEPAITVSHCRPL